MQECICMCGELQVASKILPVPSHPLYKYLLLQRCLIRKRKLLVTGHKNRPVSDIRGTGCKNVYLFEQGFGVTRKRKEKKVVFLSPYFSFLILLYCLLLAGWMAFFFSFIIFLLLLGFFGLRHGWDGMGRDRRRGAEGCRIVFVFIL
ncbi:hypothetical protein L873DRAFT_668874 [Choiromyces venosus 120613-1]|uniref:Uncharacterized protein n=1 Tax=Choiromyces venosus 120613-1 TaxID=1336337 RepID=A0A3N4IWZ1_9PEZI|nr:hypothetical protein L873DRAFT_668874 [Choiromyces venosus 120613-1]